MYGWLCVRELLGLGPGIARARTRFTEIDQNPTENSTVFTPKNLPFKTLPGDSRIVNNRRYRFEEETF